MHKKPPPRAPGSEAVAYTVEPEGSAAVGAEILATAPGKYKVIGRNGKATHSEADKIAIAMTKAFLAVEGGSGAASARIRATVQELAAQVADSLTRRQPGGGTFHIEDIQDQVELALMRAGEHKVARAYVLYRAQRAQERERKQAMEAPAAPSTLHVTLADGGTRPLDLVRLRQVVGEACQGLQEVSAQAIIDDTLRNLFDGVSEVDVGGAPGVRGG